MKRHLLPVVLAVTWLAAGSVALAQSTSERSAAKDAKPTATASKSTTVAATTPAARTTSPSAAAPQASKADKPSAVQGLSMSKQGSYEGCHGGGKVVAEADL
jgi:hypothetical protein